MSSRNYVAVSNGTWVTPSSTVTQQMPNKEESLHGRIREPTAKDDRLNGDNKARYPYDNRETKQVKTRSENERLKPI